MLGGLPTPTVDDPISGVLIALFLAGAATHMIIFQLNRRRSHKFIFSLLLFAFCMARVVALTLRIAWASRPTNVRLAIAANIFTAAGVLLLFIVNLIFAQRIVRGYHPTVGWHRGVTIGFRVLYGVIASLLIMVITATIVSFYTLDQARRRSCRNVQLFAGTFLAVLAFAPVPIVVVAGLVPRRDGRRVEKFGTGSWRAKVRLLLFTSLLLTLGAGFRIGVTFDVRPITAPAWFHHRACYYIFNYVMELIVVFTYAAARFDRRFHVPDGAKGPGDYAAGQPSAAKAEKSASLADHVNTEAEVFGSGEDDDAPPPANTQQASGRNETV